MRGNMSSLFYLDVYDYFYDCTLGRDVLKNRTFSIFQTASSQGFPLNLPCLNLYLWQKTCTSMAKTPNKNAEQKRQCKRALTRVLQF